MLHTIGLLLEGRLLHQVIQASGTVIIITHIKESYHSCPDIVKGAQKGSRLQILKPGQTRFTDRLTDFLIVNSIRYYKSEDIVVVTSKTVASANFFNTVCTHRRKILVE